MQRSRNSLFQTERILRDLGWEAHVDVVVSGLNICRCLCLAAGRAERTLGLSPLVRQVCSIAARTTPRV